MVDREDALELHSRNPGKVSVEASVEIEDREDLNLVYTPGVAEPCREIEKEEEDVYRYTSKGNLIAIVSDGSAVLGLGDIGPEASMPVMEGKANLMKKFAGVDGFPICLEADSTAELVEATAALEPGFGAVNLEDIAAPACFRVEEQLQERMDIPVFHDDQHGTAIVVAAALRNALDLAGKSLEQARIAVLGAGASGLAVSRFLHHLGAGEILVTDSSGVISPDSDNRYKAEVAEMTASSGVSGGAAEALSGADAMVGLSTGGIVSREMVESMAEDPVVMALANPDPEIMPDEAREAGAFITATGRSDFDNQVNNSLAFPGVFRGALDARASEINQEMKEAASEAIMNFSEPSRDKIVPETLDRELAMAVADAVEEAARETGAART